MVRITLDLALAGRRRRRMSVFIYIYIFPKSQSTCILPREDRRDVSKIFGVLYKYHTLRRGGSDAVARLLPDLTLYQERTAWLAR